MLDFIKHAKRRLYWQNRTIEAIREAKLTDILTDIPTEIRAGDTLSFTRTLSDYPASAGWSLSYVLINASGKITLSSTPDADVHSFTVAAGDTASYSPGDYKFVSFIIKNTTRHTVDQGSVTILPDLISETVMDGRSHAEICLANIETVLAGKATADNYSYSIAGRSLSKYSWEELIAARNYYRVEVGKEKRKASGKTQTNLIKMRFV